MKNGKREQKQIIVQQQKLARRASVKQETRRGAWAAGTTEAYEKSGEWTENGHERQATTTTNESRNQRRHKGRRLAQHRKQVVVAAIDISRGAVLKLKKFDREKRVETNGRLRRVWFSANNRKEASPDAFWSLSKKDPAHLGSNPSQLRLRSRHGTHSPYSVKIK
jgi:flagella basal body P-ring formation protein FlgA